jgi:hypothetical protein
MQVFQADPARSGEVTLPFIDDMLGATEKLKAADRRDVLLAQGIDYDAVERYMAKVRALNELYYEGGERPPSTRSTLDFVVALIMLMLSRQL